MTQAMTEKPAATVPPSTEQAPPKIPALFTPAFPLQKLPWAGALVMGHIIFSVLALSAFVFPPLFILLWLPVPAHVRRITQRGLDRIVGAWFESMASIFEVVCGITLHSTGMIAPPTTERALIIMNHPTLLDWAFLWLWLLRSGDLSCLKIVLKAQVARYPLLGWPCQMIGFLFLTREWARDEATVSALAGYWRRNAPGANVLIFPEGTNLTAGTAARGAAFCAKEGRPQYLHVLPPRTTGFSALYGLLARAGQIDAVYDLTIAYAPAPVSKEVAFVRGDMPTTVHVHCHRTPIAEMPAADDSAALGTWLWDRFDAKERILSDFYSALRGGSTRCPQLGGNGSAPEVVGTGKMTGLRVGLGLATWVMPVVLGWLTGAWGLVWGVYVGWNAMLIALGITQGTLMQRRLLAGEEEALKRDSIAKAD